MWNGIGRVYETSGEIRSNVKRTFLSDVTGDILLAQLAHGEMKSLQCSLKFS